MSVPAPGVLGNDTAAAGTVLTASLVNAPAHGTIALSANGSFIYTPQAGYSGIDAFSYRASDGSALSSATPVSITVRPVADAPVASADSFSMRQDTTLAGAVPGVLGNDTDADGDRLTATLLTAPAHGTVTLSADGSFTYKPQAGYFGADSFTYRASDGTLLSSPASVNITVSPASRRRGRAHWKALLAEFRRMRTSRVSVMAFR